MHIHVYVQSRRVYDISPGSHFRLCGPHVGRVAGREGDRRRERNPLRARRYLKQVSVAGKDYEIHYEKRSLKS